MLNAIERALQAALGVADNIGEIAIQSSGGSGFSLCHRDDCRREGLQVFQGPEASIELSKFDDSGKYRPLKTAPNLRHGWRLHLADLSAVARALAYFYPGRLAALVGWNEGQLSTTPLRETLSRQTGMYRIAATISDDRLDEVVGNFCRSDGGCLRTILWKRDERGTIPSTILPPAKFDPNYDQRGKGETAIPLLCQEACNLLVNECRKAVRAESASRSCGFPAAE